MGIYIDVGNTGFQSARKKEYIDKSGLLSAINDTLFSEWQWNIHSINIIQKKSFRKNIQNNERLFVLCPDGGGLR